MLKKNGRLGLSLGGGVRWWVVGQLVSRRRLKGYQISGPAAELGGVASVAAATRNLVGGAATGNDQATAKTPNVRWWMVARPATDFDSAYCRDERCCHANYGPSIDESAHSS